MSTAPAPPARNPRHRTVDALSPRLMGPVLTSLIGPGDSAKSPRCHVVDAKHDPETGWAVLYELGGRLVLGLVADGHGSLMGRVQAFPFPGDPALPGLAPAMDGAVMGDILSGALPEAQRGDACVVRCRVTPLRYRPLRRCTLRIEVTLRDRRTTSMRRRVLFAKLYHDVEKARSVYEDMTTLSAAEAVHRAVGVAAPVAFLPDLATVLQDHLPGRPLDTLMATVGRPPRAGVRRAEDALAAAAGGLAALHAARLPSARPRPIGPRVERMARRAARVERIDPELGRRMAALAEATSDSLENVSPPPDKLCLIHGDCKPSQFLVGEQGIGLIDFDHCGHADPAGDVGDFLASLSKLALGKSVPPQRRALLRLLEERFLDAYSGSANSPSGFAARVRWYQCVALQRKAFRAFQRGPRSPLPRMLLAEAGDCALRVAEDGRR